MPGTIDDLKAMEYELCEYLGFGEITEKTYAEALENVGPEDLIKFGLIPEFVGRLPVVTTLEELDLNMLIRIMQEPKNALIKQYTALFKMDGVNLEIKDDVSIITLDDGKVNAFSPDMIKLINELLDKVPDNKGSLLIAGREGMFSAGFDLKVMMSNPEHASQMVKSGFEMLLRIFSFPRPVVAACSGHAIAMGAFLLCSSDYRVGSQGKFKIGANELRNNMIIPTPILEIAKFKLIKSQKQRALLNA